VSKQCAVGCMCHFRLIASWFRLRIRIRSGYVGGAWQDEGPRTKDRGPKDPQGFFSHSQTTGCTGIEQRLRDIRTLVAKCVCFVRKCHIETAFGIAHCVPRTLLVVCLWDRHTPTFMICQLLIALPTKAGQLCLAICIIQIILFNF